MATGFGAARMVIAPSFPLTSLAVLAADAGAFAVPGASRDGIHGAVGLANALLKTQLLDMEPRQAVPVKAVPRRISLMLP